MLVLADYLVIALYFGGTAALLLSATRGSSGQRSAKEFFLGDGRLPGWALGVSLLGTTVSSVTFLAFPAYTLERDLRLLPKDAAAYSSLGGFRVAVLTDVLQSAVLLLSGVAALLVI